MTGIAAGDGSAPGNGQPGLTFVGVAPEADIIVVANRVQTQALGDSANTLDAVSYILKKAEKLGRPVVINQSQGDNLGPHDGSSLLERGIDNLLGGPGKAMVKSAGNAGNDDIHARGTVRSGGREAVSFLVPSGDSNPDTIDIWYCNSDRFMVQITTPSGRTAAVVDPGDSFNEVLDSGNRLFVVSVLGDPNNNDNRIFIQLAPESEPIEAGEWRLALEAVTVENGRFDAWIERGRPIPFFLPPHVSSESTISIPGTSRKVVAVGSQITKGPGTGNLSGFSSQGPTGDGRPKPEISAPGERVMSARAADVSFGDGQYHLLRGTSMAAPHVAGTIALMLEANPNLTQDQIRECLTSTARADEFTGDVPNNQWGHGKLDSQAAVNRALAMSDGREPIPDQAELVRLAGLVDDAIRIGKQLLERL